MSENEIERRHSLPIRWFHWLNFPILLTMMWSGLMIYWAYDKPYELRLGSVLRLQFFPEWLYKFLHLEGRLAEGLGWHFMFMWLFTVNGVVYVAYLVFSGEWRQLLPKRGSGREALQVLLHDLYLSRKKPTHDGYNGAQRFAYTGIIALGFASTITGFAIYKPVVASGLTALLGGYEFARVLHFACLIGFAAFFIVHLVQVARAGWDNFRGMVTGMGMRPVHARVEQAVPADLLDGTP